MLAMHLIMYHGTRVDELQPVRRHNAVQFFKKQLELCACVLSCEVRGMEASAVVLRLMSETDRSNVVRSMLFSFDAL